MRQFDRSTAQQISLGAIRGDFLQAFERVPGLDMDEVWARFERDLLARLRRALGATPFEVLVRPTVVDGLVAFTLLLPEGVTPPDIPKLLAPRLDS